MVIQDELLLQVDGVCCRMENIAGLGGCITIGAHQEGPGDATAPYPGQDIAMFRAGQPASSRIILQDECAYDQLLV